MDDSFFTRPWVWALAVCMVGLVLLARCEEEREVFDPYAGHSEAPWLGAGADDADGYALEVYEFELVENSLPPCGE